MIVNHLGRVFFCSLIILSLSACGQSKCDTDEVKSQVINILDENGGLKRYLRNNPDESIAGPTLFIKTPDHARLKKQIDDLQILLEDTEKKGGCSNAAADFDQNNDILRKCIDSKNNIISEINAKRAELDEKERNFRKSQELKFDKIESSVQYNMDKIVDRTRGKSRDRLTCRGTVTADIAGWGGAYEEVVYFVEKTTDRQSYVSVRGY